MIPTKKLVLISLNQEVTDNTILNHLSTFKNLRKAKPWEQFLEMSTFLAVTCVIARNKGLYQICSQILWTLKIKDVIKHIEWYMKKNYICLIQCELIQQGEKFLLKHFCQAKKEDGKM